jgi:hypothetical protein
LRLTAASAAQGSAQHATSWCALLVAAAALIAVADAQTWQNGVLAWCAPRARARALFHCARASPTPCAPTPRG